MFIVQWQRVPKVAEGSRAHERCLEVVNRLKRRREILEKRQDLMNFKYSSCERSCSFSTTFTL